MTSESPAPDLVDQALWHLHYADGNMCVAESGQATYLVLFTSPERAEEFIRLRNPSWGPPAGFRERDVTPRFPPSARPENWPR